MDHVSPTIRNRIERSGSSTGNMLAYAGYCAACGFAVAVVLGLV